VFCGATGGDGKSCNGESASADLGRTGMGFLSSVRRVLALGQGRAQSNFSMNRIMRSDLPSRSGQIFRSSLTPSTIKCRARRPGAIMRSGRASWRGAVVRRHAGRAAGVDSRRETAMEPGQPEMFSSCGCRAGENGLFRFDGSSCRTDLVDLRAWELLFYSYFEQEFKP